MINSVGCAACRPRFQEALLAALGDDLPKLCEDCQRRAKTNPLRIYDCKVPADQPIIDRAAALGRLPVRAVRHAFRRRARHSSTRGAFRGGSRTASCAASTTTRARRSRCWVRRSARRTRCSAAAATTVWSRTLGGPDRTGIGFAAGLERLVLALPDGTGAEAPCRARSSWRSAKTAARRRSELLRELRQRRPAGADGTRSAGHEVRR